MSYGEVEYGSDPYGGGFTTFQVLSAVSLNSTTVVVTFSTAVGVANPETLNPANYFIEEVSSGDPIGAPALVIADTDPNSVRVVTPTQSYIQYRITVSDLVTSAEGASVDAQANAAEYTGFPPVTAPFPESGFPESGIPGVDLDVAFRGIAIREDGIHLVFFQAMSVDSELLDPSNYTVTALDGEVIPVSAATPNAAGTRVVLDLVSAMRGSYLHTVAIDDSVTTAEGANIRPPSATVLWRPRSLQVKVPFSSFTQEVQVPDEPAEPTETLSVGETLSVVVTPFFGQTIEESLDFVEDLVVTTSSDPTGVRVTNTSNLSKVVYRTEFRGQSDSRSTVDVGLVESIRLSESVEILPRLPSGKLSEDIAKLFGDPQGLVYFSPALVDGGAPQSSIQVDEVSACTVAHDIYEFPQPIDPKAFFLYNPLNTDSLLNDSDSVLFANFYRLGEAQLNLSLEEEETVPPSVDIGATLQLTATIDQTRIALLNNANWTLFDGVAAPPYDFILADNLSAFPGLTPGVTHHFVNPGEVLAFTESLSESHALSVDVSDTVTQTEDFDLSPGETVVQVNVAETVTLTEGLVTQVQVNLFETVTLAEGLSISP